MKTRGIGNPYAIFKFITAYLSGSGYELPTYNSIRRMFYDLRKLRLVERRAVPDVMSKPEHEGLHDKVFYALNMQRINDMAWRSPHMANYASSSQRWKWKPNPWSEVEHLQRYLPNEREIAQFIRENNL